MARDALFIQKDASEQYNSVGQVNHGLLEKGVYKGVVTLKRSGSTFVSHSEKIDIK